MITNLVLSFTKDDARLIYTFGNSVMAIKNSGDKTYADVALSDKQIVELKTVLQNTLEQIYNDVVAG